MAVSFGCHCEERRKPAKERAWRVLTRNGNHSAFNGYRFQPTDWSQLCCLNCLASGRTRARYVDEIRDDNGEWEKALYGERRASTEAQP